MGWSHCGTNATTGAEMGYAVEALCDQPGCSVAIDHGLAYVCGGMHEGGSMGCGKYFCGWHLTHVEDESGGFVQLCRECADEIDEAPTIYGAGSPSREDAHEGVSRGGEG